VLAATCTAIFNVTQRKLLTRYSPLQTTAYAVAIATLLMVVFTPKLVQEIQIAPAIANGLVIYLGVFPAALSYFLWGYALAKAKNTSQVVGFLYLSPFLATVMAFVGLHEIIPLLSFAGGLIIIAGMVISNRAKK
jgi:drug/metabolite transporter (DMT)-like permease